MLLAFLDTETTGLDPDRHRALEIALRVIDSQTMHHIVSYETLIRQSPEVWAEADPRSLKIHGLTKEKLLDGKEERVVESELLSILKGCGLEEGKGVFLCQNPSFDRPFFSQLISQTLQEESRFPYHWLDLASMFWASLLIREPARAQALTENDLSKNRIAAFLGLPPESTPHRAMRGVDHLIACYNRLLLGRD